jgi:hypothetical protein
MSQPAFLMVPQNGYAWAPLLLALAVATFHGRASPAQPEKLASRLLLASVTDRDGRPMFDIEPDDMVVRDGGQLRDVLSIHLADYPIAIVLDNGRGDDREFEAIRRSTLRFIDRVGHRPIAIISAIPPRMAASFDDNRAAVVEQVYKLRQESSGDGLFQAFVVAARANRETGVPVSAIIAVVADPGRTLPTNVRPPVLESGANVHVVLQQKTAGRHRERRQTSIDALVALVEETHGQLVTINSPDLYQAAMNRLADQLATELMVEYLVPADSVSGTDVRLGLRLSGAKITSWSIAR